MESTRESRTRRKKSEKSKGLVVESTRESRMRRMRRKKSEKSKGLVEKSSPNSLNEETAAGSFEEQCFATCFYRFREQALVDAWPELESAAEKHGLSLTLHRDDNFYIAISTTPWTRDPVIFDMAKEFLELLATSNVPPSVAIQILNGDVHHDYIMVGHEEGGLCLEHGITKEQFAKRWKRFTHILQDLAEIVGSSVFYTGNTITTVGHSLPHVKLIRHYVEACIVHNMKPASVLESVRVRYDRCIVEKQLEDLSI